MPISASRLRENIYQILDQVLQTGVPVEIVRKGRKLRIVPEERPGRLKNLERRSCLKVDPEQIVHLDWSDEWKG